MQLAYGSFLISTNNTTTCMKTINLNGRTLKLYDSIDEMPIVNFQKYNKFILLDLGIGSDVNSVDSHLVNLTKLIKSDLSKASQELQNLRQNMYMIVSEISPKYMAFAALIHSINGKELDNLSDDNLKDVLAEIKTIKHSTIIKFLLSVKKKLNFELETFFPSEFNNIKEIAYYDKIKQRTLLVLQGIIDDTDVSHGVTEIDDYLFGLYKPKSFTGTKSAEIKYEKQFETTCMLISQKTGMRAKSMTVLEYYNTLSNIEKQVKAELKAYRKIKH